MGGEGAANPLAAVVKAGPSSLALANPRLHDEAQSGEPQDGERRASRGGAWRHAIKVSRCSARSSIPPDYRYNDYGFRVVLTVDPLLI